MLRLDIGDLYVREPRSLLIEFRLQSTGDTRDAVLLADIVVSAQVVAAAGIAQSDIRLPLSISLADGPRIDPEVRKEMLYLDAARAREQAIEHYRAGDAPAAASALHASFACFAASPYTDAGLEEEQQDLQEMAQQFASLEVGERDAKYLYQRAHNARVAQSAKSSLISRVLRKQR